MTKKDYQCSVDATLSVIGGRWKPIILSHISKSGIIRFNALQRSVEGITQRMLTKDLRELESDGVINRKVYAEVPPRVEYSVTEYGKTLEPILSAMRKWGEIHMNK
tara:strand:- start:7049 stop:7366 length:318 start_codon:yes stop_codon:yes gene_type:complete